MAPRHDLPPRWSEPCDVAPPGNPGCRGLVSPWEAVPPQGWWPWLWAMFPKREAAKLSPDKQGMDEGCRRAV